MRKVWFAPTDDLFHAQQNQYQKYRLVEPHLQAKCNTSFTQRNINSRWNTHAADASSISTSTGSPEQMTNIIISLPNHIRWVVWASWLQAPAAPVVAAEGSVAASR
jgi:hypothetical protein